jgi:hypothetical protein
MPRDGIRLRLDPGRAFELVQEGDSSIVIARVGDDDISPTTYSLLVALRPEPPGRSAFYFALVAADATGGSDRVFWSGRDVARFVDRADRRAILDRLLDATRFLLDVARPREVFRCTHDADVPSAALAKHDAITAVFEAAGYDVASLGKQFGTHAWLARRRD